MLNEAKDEVQKTYANRDATLTNNDAMQIESDQARTEGDEVQAECDALESQMLVINDFGHCAAEEQLEDFTLIIMKWIYENPDKVKRCRD